MIEINADIFTRSYLGRIAAKFGCNEEIAFAVFSIAVIMDTGFDQVYRNIVFNEKFGMISGVYISEEFGLTNINIFHCRIDGRISEKEINLLKHEYQKIFIKNDTLPNLSPPTLSRTITEYKKLLVGGTIVSPKVYYIFLGNKKCDTHLENFERNNKFHIAGEFEIWDTNDIYQNLKKFASSQNPRKPINFTFKPENSNITSRKDNQGLISFSIYHIVATIFRIHALQLCELLDLEIEKNGSLEKIFSENIRGFLGKSNLINSKILETIHSDSNVYFPFLNNGITIICEKLTLPNTPQLGEYHIPCENPVIVNGLQTSNLIYGEYLKDKESVQDIYVTIRLYQTTDPKLVELITEATNTQSAIGFQDKLSNKTFVQITKALFRSKGVNYISKRGELFWNKSVEIIPESAQNTTVLLLWYSTFFEEPFISKSIPKVVYKEIFQASSDLNHPLHSIFNGDPNSPLYSQLYFVYSIEKIFHLKLKEYERRVDEILIKRLDNLNLLGSEFVCFLVYKFLILHKQKISTNSISEMIDRVAYSINGKNIDSRYLDKNSVIADIINIIDVDFYTDFSEPIEIDRPNTDLEDASFDNDDFLYESIAESDLLADVDNFEKFTTKQQHSIIYEFLTERVPPKQLAKKLAKTFIDINNIYL
jgi:hypothetical protein